MSDQDYDPHSRRLPDVLAVDRPDPEPDADPGGSQVDPGDDPGDDADVEPLLLDFKHARRLLGISESTLYRLAPRIPGSMKLGGTWRFNRQMLLDFISCKGPGSPPKKKR
jgi:predicted DNA-binding transcriptional regulator AlpA